METGPASHPLAGVSALSLTPASLPLILKLPRGTQTGQMFAVFLKDPIRLKG